MEKCVQVICRYCAILHKGLWAPVDFGVPGGLGINHQRICFSFVTLLYVCLPIQSSDKRMYLEMLPIYLNLIFSAFPRTTKLWLGFVFWRTKGNYPLTKVLQNVLLKFSESIQNCKITSDLYLIVLVLDPWKSHTTWWVQAFVAESRAKLRGPVTAQHALLLVWYFAASCED